MMGINTYVSITLTAMANAGIVRLNHQHADACEKSGVLHPRRHFQTAIEQPAQELQPSSQDVATAIARQERSGRSASFGESRSGSL